VDAEVEEDLGAHVLADVDHGREDRALLGVGNERGVLEVLRPDPDDDAPADSVREPFVLAGRLVAERDPALPHLHREASVVALELRLDHVHGRGADEARDEEVGRPVVEHLRPVHLLEDAVPHDGDAVAHGHRLDLVVGDVDRRHAEIVLEP
jgi:hypothetical protein